GQTSRPIRTVAHVLQFCSHVRTSRPGGRTHPRGCDTRALCRHVPMGRTLMASERLARPRTRTEPMVAGIRISHPHRLIYPELDLSKLQLARYYDQIASWMVPHVRGRPLTLVHCPAGMSGPCQFMRHRKVWGPSALRRVRIREKTKIGEYLVADSIAAV